MSNCLIKMQNKPLCYVCLHAYQILNFSSVKSSYCFLSSCNEVILMLKTPSLRFKYTNIYRQLGKKKLYCTVVAMDC